MKKFIALFTIFIFALSNLGSSVYSNEIEEDYFDIAANYCVVGDYSSAIQYLDKILSINPSNKNAADLKKGLTHVMNGDKTSFVENVNPSVKRAMEYKRVGDEVNEYKTLLDGTQGQNAYLAYYYLGDFYREKNDYAKAIDAYNASTSARSDFAPAYLSGAVVLIDMGKYESAINSIDKYLTFNPQDDLAYALRSRAEFSLGFIQASKEDNDKAIALNNCADYQFDKAKILYKQGNYKEAKNMFTKLLKDIQTSKIYEYMGLCDYALQDYYAALNDFDKAILLSNDDEYLEARYNEIKAILESKNATTENE
jgi:tetratricopeptide (TPR) repeat protein